MIAGGSFWKRLLCVVVFSIVALLTLVVFAFSLLSFQGRREWAKTKVDLLARGEKLSITGLVPSPAPDDQNFFGDPFWKQITNQIEWLPNFGFRFKNHYLAISDPLDPPLPENLYARGLPLLSEGKRRWIYPNSSCSYAVTGAEVVLRRTYDEAKRRRVNQFIVDVLSVSAAQQARIEQSLERRAAVLPVDYLRASGTIYHIQYLDKISRFLYGKLVRAYIALRDSENAARKLEIQIRLANTFQNDPRLWSQNTRASLVNDTLESIACGVESHLWTSSQLIGFERELEKIDLLNGLALGLRGMRGSFNDFLEVLQNRHDEIEPEVSRPYGISPFLSPFQLQLRYRFFGVWDQSAFNLYIQGQLDALSQREGIDLAPLRSPIVQDGLFSRIRHPLLVSTAKENIAYVIKHIVAAQEAVLQTRVACAIERYWLKNKEYPASLEALAPEFLPEIPGDIFAGQSLHYRRKNRDTFHLWSSGWNGTDEGGAMNGGRRYRQIYQDPDWVWMINQS